MKDRNHANRGQAWEQYLRFANKRYEQKGIAVIEKIPTEFIPLRNGAGKIVSAKVEHKSSVDFIGRYKDHPIAIEAKNTNTESIRWDAVQPHQVEFMDKWTQQTGSLGFVLVSFGLKSFYAVPWTFWSMAYRIRVVQGNRSDFVTIHAFNEEWTIPKKMSAREAEMSPLWKVPGNDRTYGLDYLKNADRYVIQSDKKVI